MPTNENDVKLNTVVVSEFGSSLLSYHLTTVDNIDITAMKVRLVDAKGQLSILGRLEILIDQAWHTICELDNNTLNVAE